MAKATKTVPAQKKRTPRKPADILGYAWDGTPIARPPFKPKSFTVQELRRVVDRVRREQAQAKLQAG
jgi:hypothetical protein